MSNTLSTAKEINNIQELIKQAHDETKEALRHYFLPPRPDTIYERRRLLTIKEWKQRKRETEIMDLKVFSASLKLPPLNE